MLILEIATVILTYIIEMFIFYGMPCCHLGWCNLPGMFTRIYL